MQSLAKRDARCITCSRKGDVYSDAWHHISPRENNGWDNQGWFKWDYGQETGFNLDGWELDGIYFHNFVAHNMHEGSCHSSLLPKNHFWRSLKTQ